MLCNLLSKLDLTPFFRTVENRLWIAVETCGKSLMRDAKSAAMPCYRREMATPVILSPAGSRELSYVQWTIS